MSEQKKELNPADAWAKGDCKSLQKERDDIILEAASVKPKKNRKKKGLWWER